MSCKIYDFIPEKRLSLRGNFTYQDQPNFRRAFYNMMRQSSGDIKLDIMGIDQADATAVASLLAAHDFAKKNRRRVLFINPTGRLKEKLLEANHYNKLFIAA